MRRPEAGRVFNNRQHVNLERMQQRLIMPWCKTFKYKIGPGEYRGYDVVDVQVEH